MKKTLFFTVMMTLLICSCSNESTEATNEKITEADVFVASEEFQQYQAEMRKDSKMLHSIVKKLSKADKKAYASLLLEMKSTKNMEKREQLMTEVSKILNIDYKERLRGLTKLSTTMLKGKSFSNKELVMAIQRHNVKASGQVQPQDYYGELAYWICRDKCQSDYMSAIFDCDSKFPGWDNMGSRSACYSDAELDRDYCLSDCEAMI